MPVIRLKELYLTRHSINKFDLGSLSNKTETTIDNYNSCCYLIIFDSVSASNEVVCPVSPELSFSPHIYSALLFFFLKILGMTWHFLFSFDKCNILLRTEKLLASHTFYVEVPFSTEVFFDDIKFFSFCILFLLRILFSLG